MNINELTTPAGVEAYIISQLDPQIDQEIERRRVAYQEATAAHDAALQRLAAHDATSPEADPAAWAAQRRQLVDVAPIFEEIRNRRRAELQEVAGAKARFIFDTLSQLQREASAAGTKAQMETEREIDELKARIDSLKFRGNPASQEAGAMFGAVATVRNAYRDVYANHPDLSLN